MTPFLFLIIIPMLLGLWAQMRVKSTYQRYSKVASRSGLTGRAVAQHILDKAGLTQVEISKQSGLLSDHYDPSRRRLVLSEANYNGSSLAAIGVAAHEAGHAIQHKVGYSALNLRMALVPITQFASQLLPLVVLGGLIFNMLGLIWLGVAVYLVLTIFQLVTLPVEFDASRRATQELSTLGIIDPDESQGVVDTLNAAAWTYVAAFVASLGNLLYLLMIARSR